MNKFIVLSASLMSVVAVSGCGSDDATPPRMQTQAEKQQALRDSQFGSSAEALDKARAVEQLNLERKDKLDEVLE
jgi:hypothetical protein